MRLRSLKMAADVEKVPVLRLTEESRDGVEDIVARESPLTVILNDNELVTLLCTPTDLKELSVGFLSSEGLVTSRDEIKRVLVDEVRGVARVQTTGETEHTVDVFRRFISSGCGRGASFYSAADAAGLAKVDSTLTMSTGDILSLMREFQHRSELYRNTGGVHSAALCDSRAIVGFAEDVGRHNAIDKIFGRCLLEGISTEGLIVVTSGRVSSEIMLKVARRGVPFIVSKSAPTDLAVKLAADLGITLVGFVRGKRMNVYANEWRIADAR